MNYNKYTLALILLASSAMAAADFEAIWAMVQNGSIKTAKAEDLNVTGDQLELLKSSSVDRRDVQGMLGYDVDGHTPRSAKPDLEAIWAMVQDGSIKTAKYKDIHVSDRQLKRLQTDNVDKAVVAAILGVSADGSSAAPVALSSGPDADIDNLTPIKKGADDVPDVSAPSDIVSNAPAKHKASAEMLLEYTDSSTRKIIKLPSLLKYIELNLAQQAALSVPELVLTDEVIERILALKEPTVESAAKPTDDANVSKAAALSELVRNGKIELTKDVIETHKLTKKQVEALKSSKGELNLENIKKILEAPAAKGSESGGSEDLESSSDNSSSDDNKDKNKDPWYKSTPVMAGGIMLTLAAIGGGVYMMSGRNEDNTGL